MGRIAFFSLRTLLLLAGLFVAYIQDRRQINRAQRASSMLLTNCSTLELVVYPLRNQRKMFTAALKIFIVRVIGKFNDSLSRCNKFTCLSYKRDM